MLELLIWIWMSIVTQIAKKTEVDAKIIILALSVFVGIVFYFVKEAYPEMVDKVYEKALWSYAVSQVIYNYIISIREERTDKKKKAN